MNANLFRKAIVKVPNRSGFDKSFMNMLTLPVGTLVPLMLDEVVPNSRINLSVSLNAQLPPLAVNSHLRCDLKVEAFFCPMRILYAGFPYYLDGEELLNSSGVKTKVGIPKLKVTGATLKARFGAGSLADYLGFCTNADGLSGFGDTTDYFISPLPFLCYHRVWDSWYRNKLITAPYFTPPLSSTTSLGKLAFLPFIRIPFTGSTFSIGSVAEGVEFFGLRQRCFGLDYFSSATSSPQRGSAQSISIDTSGDTGSFTISALRAANSLQQFAERNNLCSDDYVDFLKVNYGSHLTKGQLQEPMYLGSGSITVYNNSVVQTGSKGSTSTTNPYDSVGSKYGCAVADGSIRLIEDFHAEEPGYILVLCSLVPQASYSTGIARHFRRYMKDGDQTNLANPVLQNTGPQPIFSSELNPTLFFDEDNDTVFGYTDRYADFMSRQDEVHGLVRDGSDLSVFALQRSFIDTAGPLVSTSFVEIPQNYLDSIFSVRSSVSKFGCIVDSYIDYKMSAPLQQFSIPSLENVDGSTMEVTRGGTVIR